MSAGAGGSAGLPPKNCFSPLAGLEAVSGGGPCLEVMAWVLQPPQPKTAMVLRCARAERNLGALGDG